MVGLLAVVVGVAVHPNRGRLLTRIKIVSGGETIIYTCNSALNI